MTFPTLKENSSGKERLLNRVQRPIKNEKMKKNKIIILSFKGKIYLYLGKKENVTTSK